MQTMSSRVIASESPIVDTRVLAKRSAHKSRHSSTTGSRTRNIEAVRSIKFERRKELIKRHKNANANSLARRIDTEDLEDPRGYSIALPFGLFAESRLTIHFKTSKINNLVQFSRHGVRRSRSTIIRRNRQ